MDIKSKVKASPEGSGGIIAGMGKTSCRQGSAFRAGGWLWFVKPAEKSKTKGAPLLGGGRGLTLCARQPSGISFSEKSSLKDCARGQSGI